MERIPFLDGIFEVADMYTSSLAPADYSRLLSSLLAKCTDGATAGFRLSEETRASSEVAQDVNTPPPPPHATSKTTLQRQPTKLIKQRRRADVRSGGGGGSTTFLPQVGVTPATRQALEPSRSRPTLSGAAPNVTVASKVAAAASQAAASQAAASKVAARGSLARVVHLSASPSRRDGLTVRDGLSERWAQRAGASGSEAEGLLYLANLTSQPLLPVLQPALPLPLLRPKAFDAACSFARRCPSGQLPAPGLRKATSLPALPALQLGRASWEDTLHSWPGGRRMPWIPVSASCCG